VVLIDIGLPGPDGFETARRLTRVPGLDPVLIAATGYDGSSIRHHAHDVGFDHFLSKPFDLDHLRAILCSAQSPVPM
jgi:CheY-like chemotaxis protein